MGDGLCTYLVYGLGTILSKRWVQVLLYGLVWFSLILYGVYQSWMCFSHLVWFNPLLETTDLSTYTSGLVWYTISFMSSVYRFGLVLHFSHGLSPFYCFSQRGYLWSRVIYENKKKTAWFDSFLMTCYFWTILLVLI